MSSNATEVVNTTRTYYDSKDADEFYSHVWGGEDIHIGIYHSATEQIKTASQRTVKTMAGALNLTGSEKVLDLGAGYGGAARYLAKTFGVEVTCLNLSEAENKKNIVKNRQAGLEDKIKVIEGNFEELSFDDDHFDIVWSEDAILHSGNKPVIFKEVARVLKPGGQFIFTDPMQTDDAPQEALVPVLQRIHLDSMGSFSQYIDLASKHGLAEVKVTDLSEHLITHYRRVKNELLARREELQNFISSEYIENMLRGLDHWVAAGEKGHLAWGILHFKK